MVEALVPTPGTIIRHVTTHQVYFVLSSTYKQYAGSWHAYEMLVLYDNQIVRLDCVDDHYHIAFDVIVRP